MKPVKIIVLLVSLVVCMACNSNKKTEANKKEAIQIEPNSQIEQVDVWQKFPLKKQPLVDTTNFDNIKKVKNLNPTEIEILQLNKIYPEINNDGSEIKFQPSYKLNLGDFKSIVINVFKGDHELESRLIVYDLNNELIEYKGENNTLINKSVVIAYDEIAEGWSRKHATIENNVVTVINEFYGDDKRVDTTKFHINNNGDINQKTQVRDSLSFEDLMLLNKPEAILKYGQPVSSEQFILDDAQGEFRNRISDVFSLKERQRKSILIEELTWEKDPKTWITVWYQLIEKKSIPKSVFSWEKGREF